jgi:RNA polymerase sigma-70 factor (ECF subfamily)
MQAAQPRVAAFEVADRLDAQKLCELYSERVYRFASMVSKGSVDSEDLAQEALERAIRAIDSYDGRRGSVDAWLWQIVVNAARDAGRVERRRQLSFERMVALLPRSVPDEVSDLDSAIGDHAVLQAIRRLRPRERALIALRYGADLDYAAVGASLGLSAEAAGVATRRALASLRNRLQSQTQTGRDQ